MPTPGKRDNNQSNTTPTYIIVTIGYSDKYIFPFEEGMDMIRAFARAWTYEESFDERLGKIEPYNRDLKINFMSEQEFKEIRVTMVLQNGNGDGK